MSTSNELRVFISSTFRDLQEEREHLIKKIFPEIRALCRARGITFTEIDLRWGLTEEESTLGKTIRICLEEVDHCRPYFIGLLGSAYGWVPDAHEIYMDSELLARYPWVEEASLEGASLTEMEFIQGVFSLPETGGMHALFYHSDISLEHSDNPKRLQSLVERARATGHPFREFQGAEELGSLVRDDLRAMIDGCWPVDVVLTDFELEQRAHAAFAASRIRAYIPQPEYLRAFTPWLAEATQPLVVTAISGMGKSSLLASLVETHRRRTPDGFVIEHYVGASDSSTSLPGMIRHLIEAIRKRFSIDEEVPISTQDLEESFPGWLYRLGHLAGEQAVPVLIVLDAVNNLEERAHTMMWLPEVIPPTIKLLISTTPGNAYQQLSRRNWEMLELKPITDERVCQSIVVRYLGEFHKGIDSDQLRYLTSTEKASSPLYLRVVAEELRLHGKHETVADVVTRYADAADLDDVFQRVLERMENDYGRDVVGDLLSLLRVSRAGLGEQELIEIIGITRLSLSQLLFAFDYHLLHRHGLLSFFHDYLRRGVEARYLPDEQTKRDLHRRIAEYFSKQPYDLRRRDEEPWQWQHAMEWDRLRRCLCDPQMFILLSVPQSLYELIGYWKSIPSPDTMIESYAEVLRNLRMSRVDTGPTVDLMMVLGEFFTTVSHFDAAEPVLQLVYRYRRRAYGHNHPDTIAAMDHLATALYHLGKYPDAELLWEEALVNTEKLFGENDARLCRLLDSLGTSSYRRNDVEAMERFCQRSLSISEESFGRDHPESIDRLLNQAEIYIVKKLPESAIPILEDLVQTSRRTFGKNHPKTAKLLGELSHALFIAEKYDQAILLIQQSIRIFSDTLGEHIALARVLESLGHNYYQTDNLISAEQSYRRAYAIRCGLQGEGHIDTLYTLRLIASVLKRQGRMQESEEIMLDALQKQRELLGDNHPDVRVWIQALANLMELMGRDDEAALWREQM